MTNRIRPKYTTVAGREPTGLLAGELATNVADTPPTMFLGDGANAIQVGPIVHTSIAPANAKDGTLWMDPSTNECFARISGAWVSCGGGAGGTVQELRIEQAWTGLAGQKDIYFQHNPEATDVYLNGSLLVVGSDYTLSADNLFINLAEPVKADSDYLFAVTYLDVNSPVVYNRDEQVWTNSAGQSTFSWTHNDEALDLFLNGSRQVPAQDYTTNGSVITLAWPLAATSDILHAISYIGVSAGPPIPGLREENVWRNVAGQDTFPWTHNITALDVYLNGIKLEPGGVDYTADNSTIVLTTPVRGATDILRGVTYMSLSGPPAAGTRTENVWTNSAGTSVFTWAHTTAALDMFLNGTRLEVGDDYSANGVTITLVTPLRDNSDVLRAVTYS